jgi:hypothetical protein
MSNLKTPFYVILVLLCFFLASFPVETFAQNSLRIEDRIGGNGSTTQGSDSNDNTFIYLAGGLLVAGIVAYALFLKKDSKPEVIDSTASLNSNFIFAGKGNSESFNESISKAKDQIPVDLFFGIRNSDVGLSNKTYLVGISVKL